MTLIPQCSKLVASIPIALSCSHFDHPSVGLFQWAKGEGQPIVLLEPEAIPHPDLIGLLLKYDAPLRLSYIESSHTALRWIPQPSLYDTLPDDEDFGLADSQEETCIARHDDDCLKWSAFGLDIGLMTAVRLSKVITVHHADATGEEGNAFLSPELCARFSSRKKAVQKSKPVTPMCSSIHFMRSSSPMAK